MKLCKRLVGLWLTLLIGSWPALAHDPNVATFVLEERGDHWILTSSFVLARARQSLATVYPNPERLEISPLELERQVVEYLRSSVDIWADGGGVPLGTGGIRLGEHQTNVRFVLDQMPAVPKELKVNVHNFDDNPQQMQLFIVRFKGQRIQRFLSAENDFTAVIPLAGTSPRTETPPGTDPDPEDRNPVVVLVLGASLLLGGTWLRRRMRGTPGTTLQNNLLRQSETRGNDVQGVAGPDD